jgi:hypothetical protein
LVITEDLELGGQVDLAKADVAGHDDDGRREVEDGSDPGGY